MSEFQALLDEIDALRKARKPEDVTEQPNDDDDPGYEDDDPDDDPEYADDDPGDDKPMVKAFNLTLGDGTEIPAYDGTELIKALQADMTNQREAMSSAIGGLVDLIKQQGRELADMRKSLTAIGNRPAGRKSVLNVHERPDVLVPGGSAPAANPRDVLNKALSAQRAGKLHGGQVAEIEAYLNRGNPVPDHLARFLAD